MSSSSRLLWLAVIPMLAACGFKPVYEQADPRNNPAVLAGVKVNEVAVRGDIIGGAMGQQLRINLEDRLNPQGKVPSRPRYRLDAGLQITEGAIGVARDGTISRYNLYIDSDYTLYRVADNKIITSGSLRNVSSYNNLTNAYFSTYVSREDAIKRGITELSELYRLRLTSYLTSPDTHMEPASADPNKNQPGGAPLPPVIPSTNPYGLPLKVGPQQP